MRKYICHLKFYTNAVNKQGYDIAVNEEIDSECFPQKLKNEDDKSDRPY